MLRYTFVITSFLLAAPAWAHPAGPRAPYTVTVEDQAGRALRTFHHRGQTYVLGEYDQRYNIRVRNQTRRRIEAVVTVDGRDAISGREGDYVKERGYVLDPNGHVLIEGFRTSEDAVAAFRFTNPGNSYSARMGTPQNVGVIGVAVFRERRQRRATHDGSRRDARTRERSRSGTRSPSGGGRAHPNKRTLDELLAGSLESAPARSKRSRAATGRAAVSESATAGRSNRPSNLGTKYGEKRQSHVRSTRFRREHRTQPTSVVTLRYDDGQGLMARGIRVPPARPTYAGPLAFPRNRFAPPPP